MKKLFFIMAMSVCAFTAQAQTTSGIRVGLNMTSATGKYNDLMADQDYNNKSYMGYSIHYFLMDVVQKEANSSADDQSAAPTILKLGYLPVECKKDKSMYGSVISEKFGYNGD